MTGVFYSGTASGYLEFARKELLKAALAGQTLTKDTRRIQHRLNRAAAQDRAKRVLHRVQRRGGGLA